MPLPTITTIDGNYVRPRFAASFLVEAEGEAAFVENNTTHSVPGLLAALEQRGVRREAVRYLIVTHIHLDHAGGTSALLQACPDAIVLAHPRAKPHLVDPHRLIAGVKAVYGEAAFEALYGTIEPIPAHRVRCVEDGERVPFGSGALEFLHTRGHANHHVCIWEDRSKSLFSGDMFGLCYPDLQGSGLLIFPSTSPTDLDIEAARQSIERIAERNPSRILLTHFGAVTEIERARRQLLAHYDLAEELLQEGLSTTLGGQQLQAKVRRDLEDRFYGLLLRFGIGEDGALRDYLGLDMDLNAAGIAFAIERERRNR